MQKKGAQYKKNSVRLHLFSDGVSFDAAATDFQFANGSLQDYYLGYITLRPTYLLTIGRTVFTPRIRVGSSGHTVVSEHHVHVLGYTLTVEGFPWMNQHTDISVCAHTACWSILRHYSERYNRYAEYLTYDITRMAHAFDPGGLVPASGLNVADAERIFYSAGTYPLVVTKGGSTNSDSFYRQLCSYLDSGFPIFAAMHKKGHAFGVTGYKLADTLTNPLANGKIPNHTWSSVDALVGVDDNWIPYSLVPHAPAGLPDEPQYAISDIDAFIVPLPEKIYYSAGTMDEVAFQVIPATPTKVNLPPKDDRIVRYFVTTSAALKRFIRNNVGQFCPNLARAVMELPLPQFVWIVEYATIAQWNASEVGVRVVLDATASVYDNLPMWMMFDHVTAEFFDRNQMPIAGMSLPLTAPAVAQYSRMENNLSPF